VELRPLLTDAVRDVRGIAESKSIDLQLVLPPKLPAFRGDRDKLTVVVNNLLGNAIKYTQNGGHVVLTCKADDNNVYISVRDSGIGIDPKDHSRIFEKFQRADDPNVRNETGTGIGLTTAREVVQQHGGEITVVSKRGEGATFTVSLPTGKHAQNLVEATN
jgi:two-component system sensor histidine kinase VicK